MLRTSFEKVFALRSTAAFLRHGIRAASSSHTSNKHSSGDHSSSGHVTHTNKHGSHATTATADSHGGHHATDDHSGWWDAPYTPEYRERIGNREVVGYGSDGEPNYIDSKTYCYPAIRWMAPTPEITALREKEQGDWHDLTIDEKKTLYRASFRETFAEMDAPTGQWKFILGGVLMLISAGLIGSIALRSIMPPLPSSMSDEARKAQLERMIVIGVGQIDGLASTWDYEKGQWKNG